MKLIVMIPAYNEQETIGKVIREIPRKIQGIKKVEVLVINDGSRDNTVEEARNTGVDYVIENKKNLGLGRTFRKGIDEALKLGADIIVNIDGDGQFNSADIPKLIQPILNNGADMTTATRFLKPELTRNIPWKKKLGNRFFTNIISRVSGIRFTDTQCGFRAYSREAALRLNLFGNFTYTQEVFLDLANKGIKIKEIPLHVSYKRKRNSHISGNLRKYGMHSLGIIARTLRDQQPLSFFGISGFILFLIGFLGALYSFIFWLAHLMTTPVRMLFNVSVFFMIFGLSLAVLGLLADMLNRMKRTQEEILYRIKKQELRR